MIVRLRAVMASYSHKTGHRMTYDLLAERTGLTKHTLQSLGARPTYNTRISTIELICRALDCEVGELLALDEVKE